MNQKKPVAPSRPVLAHEQRMVGAKTLQQKPNGASRLNPSRISPKAQTSMRPVNGQVIGRTNGPLARPVNQARPIQKVMQPKKAAGSQIPLGQVTPPAKRQTNAQLIRRTPPTVQRFRLGQWGQMGLVAGAYIGGVPGALLGTAVGSLVDYWNAPRRPPVPAVPRRPTVGAGRFDRPYDSDMLRGGLYTVRAHVDTLLSLWQPIQRDNNIHQPAVDEYVELIRQRAYIDAPFFDSISLTPDNEIEIRTSEGRHRIHAAKRAGLTHIHIVKPNTSEIEMMAQIPGLERLGDTLRHLFPA